MAEVKLYRTLIGSMVRYRSHTWILTRELKIVEKKIIRKIYIDEEKAKGG